METSTLNRNITITSERHSYNIEHKNIYIPLSFFKCKNNFEIEEIKLKINQFKNLEKNWDSYDAEPISCDAINLASNLVELLAQNNILIDSFAPMRNGGVQLEKSFYYNDIEIEIHPNNKIILLIFDKGANYIEETDYNLFNVTTLIRKLKSLDG